MTEAAASTYIGQPLRRREDFKFITGKGRYVDDIKVPGMLHMAVLRSPHAHAVIKRIDLAAAKAAPGVRLAIVGRRSCREDRIDCSELDHAGHQSAGAAGRCHRSRPFCRRVRSVGRGANSGYGL